MQSDRDRKQSTSSVLSLISSFNAPLAAMLTSTGRDGKERRGGEEREKWPPKDFRVSVIHNGWLTASGRPKRTLKRNGLLPKLHRTPRAPIQIPKWAEIEDRPPLPPPRNKSKGRRRF